MFLKKNLFKTLNKRKSYIIVKSAISRDKMLPQEKVIKTDEGVIEYILTLVIASVLFFKEYTYFFEINNTKADFRFLFQSKFQVMVGN